MATKGVDMSTGVVVADWIKRLVDEERKRDAVPKTRTRERRGPLFQIRRDWREPRLTLKS